MVTQEGSITLPTTTTTTTAKWWAGWWGQGGGDLGWLGIGKGSKEVKEWWGCGRGRWGSGWRHQDRLGASGDTRRSFTPTTTRSTRVQEWRWWGCIIGGYPGYTPLRVQCKRYNHRGCGPLRVHGRELWIPLGL